MRFLGDFRQASALDRGRGAKKEFVDERARQAHGVEDLRAAIGLVGRNAHLGHNLKKALIDRLDEALDGFIATDWLRQFLGHCRQSLEGEIGIDSFGAVTGKTCEVMDLARLAGLDDEADRGSKAFADEVMVDGRGRQKRWNWDSSGPTMRSDRMMIL